MMVDGWMLPKMRIPGDGDDEKYILLFVFFVCQRWRGVFLPRRWRIPVENTPSFYIFESNWYKYKLERRIVVLGIDNDPIFEVRKNIIQNHFDFCEIFLHSESC